MKAALLIHTCLKEEIKNKKFLENLISDKPIVNIPDWVQFIFVHGFTIGYEYENKIQGYEKIYWNTEFSGTKELDKFINKLSKSVHIPVSYGFKSNIDEKLQDLESKGVTEILILPLFPQFAESEPGKDYLKFEEIENGFLLHPRVLSMKGKEVFLDDNHKESVHVPVMSDKDNWIEIVTKWIDRWIIIDPKTAIA